MRLSLEGLAVSRDLVRLPVPRRCRVAVRFSDGIEAFFAGSSRPPRRRRAHLVPSIVLYESLRGPRLEEELAVQEELFSSDAALPFGAHEARLAAELIGA